jgi:HEAT repeat protein
MPDYIEEYLCQIKDNPDINQWDTLYTHLDAKEPFLVSLRLQDERGGRGELDVKDVVAQERRLIISGASGMGKTTTLKWLTLVYAENYMAGAERLIPLYVDLGRFRYGLFYDHALMIAHENGLEEEDFKELLDAGELAVFLDGLDMLGGSEDFEPVAEIQNFMSEFSQCKFVLSSRPGFFEGFKSSCKVSELVELDDPKIKGYIHKYLGEVDKADTLINRIFDSRNERLKVMCKNPMMLHLVIWLQENDKIADDRAGIYRESIEGIITHYREKGRVLSSNEQLVRDFLKELAFSMQKVNTVRLDYGSALDIAGLCIPLERYKRVSAEQILEDCFKLGLLHKDGGGVRFGFHQSFQEYFAAVKLKEMFEYGYDISESFSHPKWEDTLVFLSEITKRPDELFDDVIGAGEVSLAAKLTAYVDDRRVENLCALLLDRVDSRFDLESGMAVESFAHIGDRATEALIGLLIEGELDVRRRAAEALGVIGDGSAVESLIDALHDDDSWVRSEATQALGKIGNKLAVEPLIAAMQSSNLWARIDAAKALEKIGGDRAVESLIAMLQSDDLWVRSSVAISVGEIVDEKVADSIITALQSDDLLALRYIARVFEKIGDNRAGDALIAALIAALQSGDSLVCMLSRAPIIVRNEWAVEPLIGALHDDKSSVRGLAAMALGRIRDERAVEPLMAALHDADSSVRRSAAITLGKIGGDRVVELLIGALHDDKSSVRSWAAIALGTIGDDQAVEPLVDALCDSDPSVRSEAAEVLESLCGPMHRGQLEPLLKSGDKDIASAAFEILHSIELKEHGRIKIFKELKYLLRWDDIPENDSDRLLKYLLEACDIAWTERAKIRKSDDKTLIISKDENSAEIKIDERGKKATLKLSDGRTCDLNVRTKKTKSSYTTPSGVMDAEEMLADAHLGALIDRLKFVPDSITVVDYGCGKGAFLGRMKEIERELGKIHYIGVDISRG